MIGIFWQAITIRNRPGTKTLKSGDIRSQGFLCWLLGLKQCVSWSLLRCTATSTVWWLGSRSSPSCSIYKDDCSNVFRCFETLVPAGWRMRLAELSQSTLPHLTHFFELPFEMRGSAFVRGKLCCSPNGSSRTWRKRAWQGICGTTETSNDDASDKEKKTNKGSASGSI